MSKKLIKWCDFIVKAWREFWRREPCLFCHKPTGFSNFYGEWMHVSCYDEWQSERERAAKQEADDRRQIELYKKAILETQGRSETSGHPEEICDDCNGPNVVWYAPSPLWNEVCRPAGYLTDPMLCPRCFILRAEKTGLKGVWKIELE